jgi:hypothetical protein
MDDKPEKCSCPYCDADLEEAAPICVTCETVIIACVHCGEPVREEAEECPHCGEPPRGKGD